MATTSSAAFDTSMPVLVVKVSSNPLHHGRLGIARSMGRVGVPVFGVYEDRFAPGGMSKYVRGKFVWENDGASADEFLAGMSEIAAYLKRPSILVPTDDYGAILIAEHREALSDAFVFPVQPRDLPRTVASKAGLYELCRQLHVPCPQAVFPTTRAEVDEFLSRAVFPVAVKTTDPWNLHRNAALKSTMIVDSAESLLEIYDHAADASGLRLMFQEYIPRDQGEDWFFHGYCDARSDCLVAFTGVKVRSFPAYAGPTTLGRSVENPALRRQAEQLFQALEYRGIMDLDYRFDRRDGEYKLLDFNPRIGAQFRLFENEAGIDVIRALHLDLTGRTVPRSPMKLRCFMAEYHDVLAGLSYHRAEHLTFRGWLRSLRCVEERAWLDADDPWPSIVMSLRFLARGVEKAFRKVWPAQHQKIPASSLAGASSPRRRPRVAGRGWRQTVD
jgi:D-aspartate ligase